MNYSPKISIITPTWNRCHLIGRVYNCLQEQTYKNFEWIVGDDGSDDETEIMVQKIASSSPFPIYYLRSSLHIGKPKIDNSALSICTGEFILWCDSDDILLPNALENLVSEWSNLPPESMNSFIGVAALYKTKSSVLNKQITKGINFQCKLIDLEFKHLIEEDMLLFFKSTYLKSNRFPEEDLIVPESSLWSKFYNQNILVITDVLGIKEYNSVDSVSFHNKIKYARGHAFCLSITTPFHSKYLTFLQILGRTIKFIRYSFHGDLTNKQASTMWGSVCPRFYYILCHVPAFLLVMYDVLRKKVERTHLEYLKNSINTYISYEKYMPSIDPNSDINQLK
ncbi:glycosyltransferase family 2 protein [Prochlorococcus sp. MIT 1341]|uniref:glycosyltransferase family 2 protein n=1 Tax=Prochlorococcus sp. MIT 1341 TaxID=3096221 RepID=UPI002A7521E2|nr:glycosyltransferase family 2 protein [Prochlorococcus sp. MIT 1341]